MSCYRLLVRKLNWEAKSKVGSMNNAKHKAGGGDLKVSKKMFLFLAYSCNYISCTKMLNGWFLKYVFTVINFYHLKYYSESFCSIGTKFSHNLNQLIY